jgi:hypothetical protein
VYDGATGVYEGAIGVSGGGMLGTVFTVVGKGRGGGSGGGVGVTCRYLVDLPINSLIGTYKWCTECSRVAAWDACPHILSRLADRRVCRELRVDQFKFQVGPTLELHLVTILDPLKKQAKANGHSAWYQE